MGVITVGVKKAICTCGKEMRRTGGVFGGEPAQDTYYCVDCEKHIIILTPGREAQTEFTQRHNERGVANG